MGGVLGAAGAAVKHLKDIDRPHPADTVVATGPAGCPMSPLRIIVIALAALETVLWLLALHSVYATSSDPAGNAIAGAYGMFASFAWAISALPALLLGISGRSLPFALILVLLLAVFIGYVAGAQYGYF